MLRLTLCVHEATEATHSARFPLPADPLSRVGGQSASRRPALGEGPVLVAPEQRARATAEAYGVEAARQQVVPELADLDVGRWAGLPMDGLDPAELAAWTVDPSFDAHGGESLEALRARVSAALAGLDDGPASGVTVVAHPSTARAAVLTALDAPTSAFWRLDLGPGHRVHLHRRGGRWSLRFAA